MPADARRPPRSLFMLSLSMFVLAIAAMNLFRYAGYLLDDTFISFRYAKNLVEGNGLVFNRGEYVEGYTNFLFVILSAALLKLGIEPIIATKSVVAGMTLWMLYVLTRLEALGPRLMVSERMLPTVVLLLLPLPALTYWAVASFETMLFALAGVGGLAVGAGEPERPFPAAL